MDDTPKRAISEAYRKVQEIGLEALTLHSSYEVMSVTK